MGFSPGPLPLLFSLSSPQGICFTLLHIGAFDARMFPDLIALLRARGFRFITLEQAMSDPAYQTDPAIGLPGGGGFQELIAASPKLPFPPNQKPYKQLENACTH